MPVASESGWLVGIPALDALQDLLPEESLAHAKLAKLEHFFWRI